jgi:hypothetical protein
MTTDIPETTLAVLAKPNAMPLLDLLVKHRRLAMQEPKAIADRLGCQEDEVWALLANPVFNDLVHKTKVELAKGRFNVEVWDKWFSAIDEAEGVDKAKAAESLYRNLYPRQTGPVVEVNIGSKILKDVPEGDIIEIQARQFPGLD